MRGSIWRRVRRGAEAAVLSSSLASSALAEDAGARPQSLTDSATANQAAPVGRSPVEPAPAEPEPVPAEPERAPLEHQGRYKVLVPTGESGPTEKTRVNTAGNVTELSNVQPELAPAKVLRTPAPVAPADVDGPTKSPPSIQASTGVANKTGSSPSKKSDTKSSYWFAWMAALAALLLAPIGYLLARVTRGAG